MHKKNPKLEKAFSLALQNRENNFEAAENLYNEILKKDPNNFQSNFFLGILSAQTKKFNVAKQLLSRASEVDPDNVDAHNNLGNVLKELGEYHKAKDSFQKAILIQPNFALAHNNLGTVLQDLGNYQEAILSYQKAIDIQSNFAEAHSNLGAAQRKLGEREKAIRSYQKAIEIQPNNADTHYNLGIVFKELGEHQKSIICNEKAISLKPNYIRAYSNMLLTLLHLEKLDPKYYLAKAKEFRSSLKTASDDLLLKYQFNDKPKKLKIGFVSGDFRQHPVGFFLLDILKNLKNENLELIAYSNLKEEDDLSAKLKSYFINWHEIAKQDDLKIINQIRKDGIHILFDLSGHTAKNKLPIFINKPAPIQVSWAGYNGSTGIPEIDYLIGDPIVTPNSENNYYTEKIFQLPNIWVCFSPPDFEVNLDKLPMIKNKYVTFGCFNNLSKINDKVIALWSRILKEIPKSKIFLKTKELNDSYLKKKIIDSFKKNNINSDSLILEGSSPRKELLDCYNKIDIALDPFPYSGNATSFEAIWMGVPILTKKGSAFISHTTESINHNCKMSEWNADDDNDYVKKAIKFSANMEQLSEIKKNLRLTALKSPLFNSSLFAEQLNNALWKMWGNFVSKK